MEPTRFSLGKSNPKKSTSQRCNSLHFQNSKRYQSLSNNPITSESVNWSLYADKLREAVSGLEILGEKCFQELETVSPSSQEHISSNLLTSKANSVCPVPKCLKSTPVEPNRSNVSFGIQNKILPSQRIYGRQLNFNGLPVLNCDGLSHSTIRQLASLHYLQSPPSRHNTITCIVKDTEYVLGKKDGEILELIDEGWAEPVFLGNDRELKKQTHGLLAQLERYNLAMTTSLQNLPADNKEISKKNKRPCEENKPSLSFRTVNEIPWKPGNFSYEQRQE